MLAWRAKYIEWLHRASNPSRANNVNEGALPIASMTGFARAEGAEGAYEWAWEVKSVNSRGLDTRFRLPPGHDALDAVIRESVGRRFKRGAVSVSLALTRAEAATALRINRDLLDEITALHKDLAGLVDATPPRLEGLLAVRGVIETIEDEEADEARSRRIEAMTGSLEEALAALADMRAAEGARLADVLTGHLDEIARLAGEADASAALQPEARKARLREQVAALLEAEPALPEDRLAQEAAIIAAKSDVREELDRLEAHIAATRELISGDGAVGRKLDFLCQELNREANTLCSKSSDVELTRIGLGLKAAIEQLREQVQNIE